MTELKITLFIHACLKGGKKLFYHKSLTFRSLGFIFLQRKGAAQ